MSRRWKLAVAGACAATALLASGAAPAQAPIAIPGADSGIARDAPRAIDEPVPARTAARVAAIRPFGFNLFTGGFRSERDDGLNPDYVIVPGDRITVRIWGATTFDGTLPVDSQGKIFIPGIGPVQAEGVRNEKLHDMVEQAVRTVFTRNVNVYTNLEGTQPVSIYVTGFVTRPGTYTGVSTDSLLYFLDRAGGIDLERGSFRDISVMRDNRPLVEVDLYEFILDGRIPKPQFTDGDTIVVRRRLHTVAVEGEARNAFEFEIPGGTLAGTQLIELAGPMPDTSHATISGVRARGPVSAYVPLQELAAMDLAGGDRVVFESDRQQESMLVRVEGSHFGPSRLSVPVDARLVDVLHHIEVDPALADVEAVSLRRASVAARQKKSIDDSLRRLETAVLGATSQTDEEAKIRVEEAKLITDFVARAREVEPAGVLVVARNGVVGNILLQPEDVISIPEKTNIVLVSGEVLVPQALVFQSGASLHEYVDRVGGFTDRADESRFLVIRRNAEVVQGSAIDIHRGDEIVVLPKVPSKFLQVGKTIVQVIYQLALSTAIALSLD